MAHAVNAGARLDRLAISSFHYRIFWLVGAGMFFDGYDLYIAGGVLASAIQSKFSTVPQNLQFISLTFVGMTLGALITGFVGDKFGRRFTYQINLLIFGLAALAAAFAQDMTQLITCRFVQGLGLGAEIVVGYSTLTEFVPPKTRGRWLSMMAFQSKKNPQAAGRCRHWWCRLRCHRSPHPTCCGRRCCNACSSVPGS
jgi:putative MFS transporter